jgi:2-keto-myo-inositol isomerase
MEESVELTMRACLNGATTMPYPLDEDIRAARFAGFEAVEIWRRKLIAYLEEHSVAELRQLLRTSEVTVAAICPVVIDYGDRAAPSQLAIKQAAEVAAEIDCRLLVVCLARPTAGLSETQALEIAAAEVAKAADVVATHGISLAIEPLAGAPPVTGPREALTVVELAGRSNVGILVDTFHYYKAAVPLADIAAIPVEKLKIVHVNGCEDRPRAELRDSHRLYPTLGAIPAAPMLAPLYRNGYQGYLSVEVFQEDYWRRPIDEIATEAKSHLNRLMAQIVHLESPEVHD